MILAGPSHSCHFQSTYNLTSVEYPFHACSEAIFCAGSLSFAARVLLWMQHLRAGLLFFLSFPLPIMLAWRFGVGGGWKTDADQQCVCKIGEPDPRNSFDEITEARVFYRPEEMDH